MIDLMYLVCTILLPIIPAYLLFKALGSTGDVAGGVLGFKIKLGGAFGGYFAVVLLVFYMYNVWHPTYSVSTVSGKLTDVNGAAIGPLDRNADILLNPPFLDVFPDGRFKLKYYARRGEYPTLVLQHASFAGASFDLNPWAIKNDENGQPTLGEIHLKKDPAYDPTKNREPEKPNLAPYPAPSIPATTLSANQGH